MPGITDTIVATKPSEATVPEALISSVNRAQLAKQKGDLQAKDLALKDLVLGLKQDALRREIKAGKDSLAQEQKFYTLKREYDSLQDTKTLENQYDAAYRKGDKKEMSHLSFLLASRKDASAAWKAKYHSTTPAGLAEAGLTGAGRDAYLRKQGINPSDADALAIVTGAKLDFGSPTHAKRGGALSDNQYLDILLRAGDVVPKAGTLTHTTTKPTDQESKLALWNKNEPFIVSTRGMDYFNQIKESILSEREVSDAEIQYAIGNMDEQEYKDALAIEQKRKAGAETQAVQVLSAEIDKMKDSLMNVNGWSEEDFNLWKASVIGKEALEGAPIREDAPSAGRAPTGNEQFNIAMSRVPEDTDEARTFKSLLPKLNPDPSSGFQPTYQADRLADIMSGDDPQKYDEARIYLRNIAKRNAGVKAQDWYEAAIEMEEILGVVKSKLRDPDAPENAGMSEDAKSDARRLRDKLKRWGRGKNWIKGALNHKDLEIADLAQMMNVVMQKYRKAISGAAFSEKEAAEYTLLFGTVRDAPNLLSQKVSGMLDVSIQSQRRFYEIAAGNDKGGASLFYETPDLTPSQLEAIQEGIQKWLLEGKSKEAIIKSFEKPYGGKYLYPRHQMNDIFDRLLGGE